MRAPRFAFALLATSCAASTTNRPRPTVGASAAPAAPSAVARELALFVRDSTARELDLAALLTRELERRGVRCRVVIARAEKTPPWTVDAPAVVRSGAGWAARVTVITRQQHDTPFHDAAPTIGRATGVVVGPTFDRAPPGFPELNPPGGLVRMDAGSDDTDQDLRLEVMASLRRTRDERPIARWGATEGSLRRLQPGAPRADVDPWPAIYRAVASRLADLITDAMR